MENSERKTSEKYSPRFLRFTRTPSFRPHPVEATYQVFLALLALLNSKALNQGTVSAVASMSKTHLSIHRKSTPCSSNSIYTTNSINLPPASPVPWQVGSFVSRPSSVLADMPEKLPKTSLCQKLVCLKLSL